MRVVVFLGILATGCAAVRSPGGADPARQSATLAVQSAPGQEGAPACLEADFDANGRNEIRP
jgi:hypothetical protein